VATSPTTTAPAASRSTEPSLPMVRPERSERAVFVFEMPGTREGLCGPRTPLAHKCIPGEGRFSGDTSAQLRLRASASPATLHRERPRTNGVLDLDPRPCRELPAQAHGPRHPVHGQRR
jgi:hypothetical protein